MQTEEFHREKLKRFAKLRPLTARQVQSTSKAKDFDAVFSLLAKQLENAGKVTRIQFRLLGKQKKTDWSIVVDEESSKVKKKPAVNADLCITFSEKDAWDIFRGEVSPIEVFASGRMLVRGDCEMAKQVYRMLAADGETELF